MTLGDMEQSVAAYLNQDLASFTVNGVNLVRQALDRASLSMQRRYNFAAAYTRQTFSMDLGTRNDFPDNVKKFDRAWINADLTVAGPIPIINESAVARRSGFFASGNGNMLWDPVLYYGYVSSLALVVSGRTFYLFPTNANVPLASTTNLAVDVDLYQWFPTYNLQTQDYTDFFLEVGPDCLLYRAVKELSFRKQSSAPAQQLQLSAAMLEEAWQSLVAFDTDATEGSYRYSLD